MVLTPKEAANKAIVINNAPWDNLRDRLERYIDHTLTFSPANAREGELILGEGALYIRQRKGLNELLAKYENPEDGSRGYEMSLDQKESGKWVLSYRVKE